jgi:hypothetical protein
MFTYLVVYLYNLQNKNKCKSYEKIFLIATQLTTKVQLEIFNSYGFVLQSHLGNYIRKMLSLMFSHLKTCAISDELK